MSTSSKLALALVLLAAAPLGASGLSHKPSGVAGMDFGQDKKFKARPVESSELREAVDETQVLVDGLARETVRQDPSVSKELLHSLRMEYQLPEAEDRARKALELGEEIVRLQAGLDQLKDQSAEASPAARDRLEPKILGTQSDLMGQVEDLRKVLRSLHKDLKEEKLRDLRNWMMVSEGLLRRRREAAEEAAKREAAAQDLSGDASVTAPPPDGAEPQAQAAPATPTAAPARAAKPKGKAKPKPKAKAAP